METLIEDVIAANQYYNLKYGVIESRYDELYNITINDLLLETTDFLIKEE